MSNVYADVRLGAQGRLVVPAPIRKALGFAVGEKLVARVKDEHLVIEKAAAVERRLHERFRKVAGRSLAEELLAERHLEAQSDDRP